VKNITLFVIIFLSLVFARRDCLKYANQTALDRTLERPVRQDSTLSPNGYFFIHYDTTETDLSEASPPDLIDENQNGVPDYIDEVGAIADSARKVLVEIMGYQSEPFDSDSIYDIYIMDYPSYKYGYNIPEDDGTSHLRIDNDFIPHSIGTDISPLDIMRITLVHEYFHAIHWGYRRNLGSNAYFYEMSAMWFEDVMVPEGNDYLGYTWINDLFDHPTRAFNGPGPGYELALFGHYLSSFIDPNGQFDAKQSTIMREIWKRYQDSNSSAFSAVQDVLINDYEIPFIEAWTDFISRNLYNGIDESFYYYGDQALIDPIKTTNTMLTDSVLFELDLDNKSATIESFRIGSLESIFTIEHGDLDFTGRVAIISTDNYEYNNLFWGSDTTVEESFNNAEVHFVYGIDGTPITLPIEITAHTVPLSPSNLMAVAAQDSIILSWNPSPGPGDPLSYEVFSDNILIDSLNDTNYVDKNIEGGQSYTYKVTCRNTVGESSASNTISIISWPDAENVLNSNIIKIYPNPIRQSQELTILYALDSDYSEPIINLINVRGEVVNSIKLSSFSKGWHRENINSILNTNPSNGVYFISLQPDQESRHTKKIAILN